MRSFFAACLTVPFLVLSGVGTPSSAFMGRSYVERLVVVHHEGARMARRLPAPGVLACIPMIDRAEVEEKALSALRAAVEAGTGFRKRDGVATCVVADGGLPAAPKAVRALLASLPKSVRCAR